MRIRYRSAILLVVIVCAIPAAWVGALLFKRAARPYFSVWDDEWSVWPVSHLASIGDSRRAPLVYDEERNALFIVPDPSEDRWVSIGRRPGRIRLGCKPGIRIEVDHIDDTLFVGTFDGTIHSFPLAAGVARTVVQAVREKRCPDARQLLRELYEGDDRDALSEAFGLTAATTTSAPASAPKAEP